MVQQTKRFSLAKLDHGRVDSLLGHYPENGIGKPKAKAPKAASSCGMGGQNLTFRIYYASIRTIRTYALPVTLSEAKDLDSLGSSLRMTLIA